MQVRVYDFKRDPEKIVKHLYTHFQGPEGIEQLKKSDQYIIDRKDRITRFVLEIKDEIHSSCVLIKGEMSGEEHKFYLYSVITSEQFRGKEITSKLLSFVIEWARKQSGRLMVLSTWQENTRAINFYKKMGFIEYGRLPGGILNQEGTEFTDEVFFYRKL